MKYEFKAQIDASKRGHHEKTAKQPKVIAAVLEEKTTQPSLQSMLPWFHEHSKEVADANKSARICQEKWSKAKELAN
jgi:hypothetical protein